MNRILQVDFFRGIFLILITTNHFLSKENIIHHFTYEYIGWVTAAEGFVFLSGLTAGIVYARKLVEKGENFISLAAKNRAWTIYKYHLLLFLLVTFVLLSIPVLKEYWFFNLQEYKQLYQNPILSVMLGSLLLYQPIYLDILPMYALYMLLLPFVLKNFQNGNHLPVLVGSFFIYLVGTFDLLSALSNQVTFLAPVHTGLFNVLSWQFLFVSGLYFGFLTYQNQTSRYLNHTKLLVGAFVICCLLFVFKQVHHKIPGIAGFDLDYWAGKENLGPLRLLHFFSLALLFSYLAARLPRWFSLKPICYLGQYSLEVFSIHIVLVIFFRPLEEYANHFHAVQINEHLYFYPWATLLLLLVLIPTLFLVPVLKNYTRQNKLKLKVSS